MTDEHAERKTLQFETLLQQLRDADIAGREDEAAWLYGEIAARLGRLEGLTMASSADAPAGSYRRALAILNGTRP